MAYTFANGSPNLVSDSRVDEQPAWTVLFPSHRDQPTAKTPQVPSSGSNGATPSCFQMIEQWLQGLPRPKVFTLLHVVDRDARHDFIEVVGGRHVQWSTRMCVSARLEERLISSIYQRRLR